MTDAVNCALHISVNSGSDSEVEVTVDRSTNTSVHLRYEFVSLTNSLYQPHCQTLSINILLKMIQSLTRLNIFVI